MQRDAWLEQAVSRGIISPAQRAELLAMDARATAESPSRMTAVTIAYGVGGLLALFAMGWFVTDLWDSLGGWGVLTVALGYGALFLLVARVLQREGFPMARGLAVMLAVAMVPLGGWGAGVAAGLWSEQGMQVCAVVLAPFAPCDSTPMALELLTVLAALVAIRRVAFGPLAIPLAGAAVAIPLHLLRLLRELPPTRVGDAWGWLFAAAVALVAAYAVERRTVRGSGPDYATWMHLAAAIAVLVGLGNWSAVYGHWRHTIPLFALAAFVVAVYLRRVAWTVTGGILLLFYLIWLANDVLKLTLAFPLLLVVLGLVIIIGTVWVQRRLPTLMTRELRDARGRPQVPFGWIAVAAPLVLTTAMLLLLVPDAARAERRRALAKEREYRRQTKQAVGSERIRVKPTPPRPDPK